MRSEIISLIWTFCEQFRFFYWLKFDTELFFEWIENLKLLNNIRHINLQFDHSFWYKDETEVDRGKRWKTKVKS